MLELGTAETETSLPAATKSCCKSVEGQSGVLDHLPDLAAVEVFSLLPHQVSVPQWAPLLASTNTPCCLLVVITTGLSVIDISQLASGGLNYFITSRNVIEKHKLHTRYNTPFLLSLYWIKLLTFSQRLKGIPMTGWVGGDDFYFICCVLRWSLLMLFFYYKTVSDLFSSTDNGEMQICWSCRQRHPAAVLVCWNAIL